MNLRVLALAIAAVASMDAQVTFERLLHANQELQNWMTFGGTYNGQHYSLLTQITPDNAKRSGSEWVFPVRSLDAFEYGTAPCEALRMAAGSWSVRRAADPLECEVHCVAQG
jgi:hypothetical protein